MDLLAVIREWTQIVLNAGALIVGGTIWKLYFANLRASLQAKEAEADLAEKRAHYWQERATDLEKRSPEAVEEALASRIKIREEEIQRLSADKQESSRDLSRHREELDLLQRVLDHTKGFREILALEQPAPGDPDYESFIEYYESRPDSVVDIEVVHLGTVGVDSGQLMITDPCYIDDEWQQESFESFRAYRDLKTNHILAWGKDFRDYNEPIGEYGLTVNEMVAEGRLVKLEPAAVDGYKYSYNGACQATLSDGFGELAYLMGHSGAGVVFRTGWGDGSSNVYGERHNGQIMRVYINVGAEPAPPLAMLSMLRKGNSSS